jgi:hypothetical protein
MLAVQRLCLLRARNPTSGLSHSLKDRAAGLLSSQWPDRALA